MGNHFLTAKRRTIVGSAVGIVVCVLAVGLWLSVFDFLQRGGSPARAYYQGSASWDGNRHDRDSDWQSEDDQNHTMPAYLQSGTSMHGMVNNDDHDDGDGDNNDDQAAGDLAEASHSPAPTPDIGDLEVKPNVAISLPGSQLGKPLNGNQGIRISVDHAKEIDVFLQRPESLSKLFLGTAKQSDVNKERWHLMWHTRQTPNGEYVILAQVTNVFGQYESRGPVVAVDNRPLLGAQPLPSVAPLPLQVMEEIGSAVRQTVGVEEAPTSEPLPAVTQPSGAMQQFSPSPQPVAREEEAVEFISELPPVMTQAVDSDGDGLTNEEEERLNTDSLNPDTDGDGYIDGLEIARGYNPLAPSPGDKIVFTEPKDNVGETRDDVYRITGVTVEEKEGQEVLFITGRARPLTFVTLFVYSDLPLVVTVLTDERGNFTYELSKTLDSGEHQIYIALADSDGFLVEKSSPFSFVKAARAVTVSDPLAARAKSPRLPPETPARSRSMVVVAIGLMVVAVILMIVMLSILVRRRDRILTSYTG